MKIKETMKNHFIAEEKLNKKKLIITIIAALVAVLAVIYIGLALYFQGHFAFRTSINGIGVSMTSTQGVEKKITKNTADYVLTLAEREDESETINGEAINLTPKFNDDVEKLLRQQNGFAWPYYLFHPCIFETETMVEFDQEALETVIADLKCMNESSWTESKDAHIRDYTKDGYEIEPEVYGTTIDKRALEEALEEAVVTLQDKLDLSEAGCYVEPKVTKEDDSLKKALDTLNQYTGISITYDGLEEKEKLTGETISEWLSVDDTYKVKIDEDAVLTYVKTIAKQYNTMYGNRTLDTSYNQTVTIYGGSYGWKVDNAAEVEMIVEDMKAGEDVTREPVYSQTANSHGEKDYGDTYIEINLTAQHLFFYKDGALIVDTDFVSGSLKDSHGTPTGSYGLTYKTKDATLRGPDYESKVSFWMPFNGDVGMHDASWRGTFGGTIYKRTGSHGCVNLPYSAAKTIYENIEAGYPVLVYELPGTESAVGIAQDEAAAFDAATDGIGNVTLDSGTLIASLRAQYDALSDRAKKYVKKLDVLANAEMIYSQLLGQANAQAEDASNQQAADAVTAEINALPATPTAADAPAITKARGAYNALNDAAKAKVPQAALDKLAAAELAIATI